VLLHGAIGAATAKRYPEQSAAPAAMSENTGSLLMQSTRRCAAFGFDTKIRARRFEKAGTHGVHVAHALESDSSGARVSLTLRVGRTAWVSSKAFSSASA
jgi:hypothetical protein